MMMQMLKKAPLWKVSYQTALGEAKNSEGLSIVFVFHLVLIHFGEWNYVTAVAKTWDGDKVSVNEENKCRSKIICPDKSQRLALDGVVGLNFRLIFVVKTEHGLPLDVFLLVCLSINFDPGFLQLLLCHLGHDVSSC